MFSKLLNKIGKGILAIAFVTAGVIGYQQLAFGAIQGAADFHSSLASGITTSATTMTLVSTSTPSGENLVQGRTYGFKLGGREFVSGTLSSGKQITSMTRGLSLLTGTTTGGIAETWGRGTSVEITDSPLLLQISNKVSGNEYFDSILTYSSAFTFATSSNQLASTQFVSGAANTASTSAVSVVQGGANTFTGNNTFTPAVTLTGGFTANATSTLAKGATISSGYDCGTGSASTQVCAKAYIDGVAVAGASNANDTTKGIVEMATGAEAAAGTSAGGTGARLAIGANISTNVGGTANTVVVTNSSGKVDSTFLSYKNLVSGADSTVAFDGTNTFSFASKSGNVYTLTRDVSANVMTVSASVTINTAGYKISAASLTNSGTIQNNGGAGGVGAAESTGGTAGTAASGATLPAGTAGQIGGAGGGDGVNAGSAGVAGTTITYGVSVAGSAGGNGGSNGTGGTGGAGGSITNTRIISSMMEVIFGYDWTSSTAVSRWLIAGGSASGGGGGSNGGNGHGGAGGGGSGGSGGYVFINASTVINSGTIQANGGAGGMGGTSTFSKGHGGGGGGGAGGVVVILTNSYTNSGTVQASGGAAGALGGGVATAGTAGSSGVVVTLIY